MSAVMVTPPGVVTVRGVVAVGVVLGVVVVGVGRCVGVVVLGVAIQDKDPASLEFIQRFGLTFPNAPDPTGKVSIDYGVYGVPETFVIDRRGVIRRKHVGAVTEAVFREWVEPLLDEGAATGGARRIPQAEGHPIRPRGEQG